MTITTEELRQRIARLERSLPKPPEWKANTETFEVGDRVRFTEDSAIPLGCPVTRTVHVVVAVTRVPQTALRHVRHPQWVLFEGMTEPGVSGALIEKVKDNDTRTEPR